MPVYVSSQFDGLDCQDPKILLKYAAKMQSDNPDSNPLLESEFLGKANGYRNPLGPGPGIGWVLLLKRQLDQIAFEGEHKFSTIEDESVIVHKRMTIVDAICLTPGTELEPDAMFILKFADPRYDARKATINQQFNVHMPEYPGLELYYPDSLQCPTWDDMVGCIWDTIIPLGAYPGIGIQPHGTPNDFKFLGVNSMDALTHVLIRLGCALNYISTTGTFAIQQIANPNPVHSVVLTGLLTKYADKRIDDEEPPYNPDFPEYVVVNFHKRDWSYGFSAETACTEDEWRNDPIFQIQLLTNETDSVSGTYHHIWDDLPAIYDQSGVLINQCDLQDRAEERMADYLREKEMDAHRMHKWFSGHCLGEFAPGPRLTGVAYYDHGQGLKTEILIQRDMIHDAEGGWPSMGDVGSNAGYHASGDSPLTPPDITRMREPYTRIAHGVLIDRLPPYGFARARVHWKPQQSFTSGETIRCDTSRSVCDWPLTQNPPLIHKHPPPVSPSCSGKPYTAGYQPVHAGDLIAPNPDDWIGTQAIIQVHDFHGVNLQPNSRVSCIYHWQSGNWIVFADDRVHFWAALLARSGFYYSWIEAEHNYGTWVSFPPPDARCGNKNAVHVNGSRHNCQGGLQPEVVRMRRGWPALFGSHNHWIFEYSDGPLEADYERYRFQLNDSWDRNNAPECTKGVTFQITAISLGGGNF